MGAEPNFNAESTDRSQERAVSATPSVTTARSVLIDWANEQDSWIRAVAFEVIVTRKEIQDDRVSHFYHLLLREKGIEEGESVSVAFLSADPAASEQNVALKLTAIESVENVNALASGQSVEFSPGLSVFFGENASGKSGYVRILKKVSNARSVEDVIPNIAITIAASQSPKACIKYSEGTTLGQVDWKNDTGVLPLTRIDVFDSRSTQLHLDDDLTYIYTPGELAFYPLIQQSIEKVRKQLETDIKLLKPTANPHQASFRQGTTLHAKIGSITASSKLEEFRTLSSLSENEKAESATLKAEVEALRSQTPQAQLRLAEQEQALLQDLKTMLRSVSGLNLALIRRMRADLAAATEKYKSSTETTFAGTDIPNVLRVEWKVFIEAGEAYLKSIDGHAEYPAPTDQCIYCRQSLGTAAVDLLKKYRDYNNGALRDEVNKAERSLKAPIDLIRNLPIAALSARTRQQTEAAPSSETKHPLTPLFDFLTRAESLQKQLVSGQDDTWDELSAQTLKCNEILDSQLSSVSTLIADLKQKSDQKQIELSSREMKIAEFTDRLRLAELLTQIEDYILRLSWTSSAEAIARGFQSILRSLTSASKSASEKLLNHGFQTLFEEECAALHAPVVKLGFPGRQGQVTRKKTLSAQYHLSEILSEGEQKVIALADFIAELRLKKAPSPVIFDDPITSLDYRRMRIVVDRLASLVRERQVIVFSHNIWFVTELLAENAKRSQPFLYYDIEKTDGCVGIVTKGTHPRADTVSTVKGKINKLIQDAGALSGESQQALIETAYEYLRNICEIIVESELLQGVTQRYQANVSITKLCQIKADRLREASDAIALVYDRCCRQIVAHSQPIETLNVRPTLAELKNDWQAVQDARDKYNRNN